MRSPWIHDNDGAFHSSSMPRRRHPCDPSLDDEGCGRKVGGQADWIARCGRVGNDDVIVKMSFLVIAVVVDAAPPGPDL